MAQFEPAFQKTNGTEGGVNFNPDDKGNVVVKGIVTIPTYKGIAPSIWGKWGGWKYITGAMAQITPMPAYGSGAYFNWAKYLNGKLAEITALQQLVIDFFKTNFWDSNRLGEINSQFIAEWTYDHIVNAGTRGCMWLQLAAKVNPDGSIGPKTIETVNAANPHELLRRLTNIAGEYRLDRAHDNPSQIQFLSSWLRRDGQSEAIIALVMKAAADGKLDDSEVSTLKADMEAA